MRVITCSPRVPAGTLSAAAWTALRQGPSYAVGLDPQPLREAGMTVTEATAGAATAGELPADAVVLVSVDDAETLARLDSAEIIAAAWDAPGARLLDAVAVVDRLRSPGGCPWDAEQTHASLRPYLVEETYEALDALVGNDFVGLCEELGDVLFQVLFHARIAAEAEGWSIDDVAAGLVAKLIRRHPHVFADVTVTGPAEVHANWDAIKKAEKQRDSVLDGVPRSLPALALAETLQRKAARAGIGAESPRGSDGIGADLFALVARARAEGVDAEQALRDVATAYDAAVRESEQSRRRP